MRWLRGLVKLLVFLALFWLGAALVRVQSGEIWGSVLANPLGVFP